jgi:tRNA pseudouridine38-40 synthase
MTQRWKITLEYHGAGFVGWQWQDGMLSVQQAVEAAITGVAGEAVRITAAGRTDAGVHALGQVAHFDLEKQIDAFRLREALNAHLRFLPVAVLLAEKVGTDFDARLTARSRAYEYRILNRRAPPTVRKGLVWHVKPLLDAGLMHAAAQLLVGTHDFTSFRAAQCQAKSPVRTIDRLDISRAGEDVIAAIEARSFLHHQVRNIMGTLKLVGEGAWPVEKVAEVLAAKHRRAAGPTAPPEGLYFVRVEY